jgi:hypothetical protein
VRITGEGLTRVSCVRAALDGVVSRSASIAIRLTDRRGGGEEERKLAA